MCLFSIQLNSNRPDQIVVFFDNVEATADAPEDIEILLHYDTGDKVMEALVEHEQKVRRFSLRSFHTDLVKGYSTLWKPLNVLWKETHPDAYFVLNLSDEMLFETQGWDSIIRQYIGYYPDHMFRLRCSKYRFRNYTDFWENGYAPDSLAFYTRKWLELSGDWNPCLGPDSFQQCVAFYLFTSDPFSHTQHNRDIAVPELRFSGEGAGIGLEGLAKYKRILINNRAWFILMSQRMQEEAKRRAMRMKSYIIASSRPPEEMCKTIELPEERRFAVVSQTTNREVASHPYKLSWLRIALINAWRARCVHYYAGGGVKAAGIHLAGYFIMLVTYLPRGAEIFTRVITWRESYHAWRARTRHPINHIKGLAKEKLRHLQLKAEECYLQWQSFRNTFWARNQLPPAESSMEPLPEYSCGNLMEALLKKVWTVFPDVIRSPLRPLMRKVRTLLSAVKEREKAFYAPLYRCVATLKCATLKRIFHLALLPLMLIVDIVVETIRIVWVGAQKVLLLVRTLRGKKTHGEWRPLPQSEKGVATVQSEHVLFSLQLSSNRPANVIALLDNVEQTANHPETVEVLVHIDLGDTAMESMLQQEQQRRRVKVKYLATDLVKGFTDLWKSYNPLFRMTNPNAYFVTLLSDEMRFESPGWDTELLKLRGYYPDHIFRVRASKYRFRNYTDFWECGFAPDSLAFYTRQWLALQGDWNPCTGPDSFQQCVAYYLVTSDPFSHTQFQRDIAAPFLKFSGEGASVGLEGEARDKRIRDNNREWFTLMSPAMQENAKRRAMLLKAASLMHSSHVEHPDAPALTICENHQLKHLALIQNGQVVHTLPYGVPRLRTLLTNALRAPWVHYYAGGGAEILRTHPWNGVRMMLNTYSPKGRKFLTWLDSLQSKKHMLIHRRNHVMGTWKHHGFVEGSGVLMRQARQRLTGRKKG